MSHLACLLGKSTPPSSSLEPVGDEAHGGRRAHVLFGGLDPLVARLRIRHVLRVLLANLPQVVNLVAQRERIVAVIDRFLAAHVQRHVCVLLRGVRQHALLPITVIEVSVFKESDALGAQGLCDVFLRLESSLILWLATEAAIAWLKVRACDVARRQDVKSSVELLTGTEGVLELSL